MPHLAALASQTIARVVHRRHRHRPLTRTQQAFLIAAETGMRPADVLDVLTSPIVGGKP